MSDFGPATGYLATLKDRFWLRAGYEAPPGSFNVQFVNYSVPMHDLRTATSTNTVRAFQSQAYQSVAQFSNRVQIGDYIPWNDDWGHDTVGTDRLMMAVNPVTGEYWGFNGTDLPLGGFGVNQCIDRNPFGLTFFDGPNAKAGFDENNPNHKCFYGLSRNTVTPGTNGDAYTFTDGTTTSERGSGVNKFIGIVRAAEVQQGAIRHALPFTVQSMVGVPTCSPGKGISDPRATTGGCGFYLAPAARVEFETDQNNLTTRRCSAGLGGPADAWNAPTPANRLNQPPHGLRIAVNITDAQINNWLDSRGFTGAKRNTARIFAVAMRDYGGIVLETGCYGIGMETDGLFDTRPGGSRDIWASLGITAIPGDRNPHGDLLQGLMNQSNIYVVNPPPG